MKFEVGKAYRTRDGKKAVLACNLNDYAEIKEESDSLIFIVDSRYHGTHADGSYLMDHTSNDDVVFEWHEPVSVDVYVIEYEHRVLRVVQDPAFVDQLEKRRFKARLTEIAE